MKKVYKILALPLMLFIVILSFTGCGGNNSAPTNVNCILGTSEYSDINTKGTSFNITLESNSYVYYQIGGKFNLDKIDISFNDENGTVYDRNSNNTLSEIPAGKYSLKIVPKTKENISANVLFYDAKDFYDAAQELDSATYYNEREEIDNIGKFFYYKVEQETLVNLKADSTKSLLESWRFFGAEVLNHDKTEVIISDTKPIAVLKPNLYVVRLFSTSSKYNTNGRAWLINLREYSEIIEDKISEIISMPSNGARRYFNNTANGNFEIKLLDIEEYPSMKIYGTNGIIENNPETNTYELPKGEYLILLNSTTLYQARARVSIKRIAPAI